MSRPQQAPIYTSASPFPAEVRFVTYDDAGNEIEPDYFQNVPYDDFWERFDKAKEQE